MFYLSHLSDIHLMPLPKVNIASLLNKRLVGYINWHKKRAKLHTQKCLARVLEHMLHNQHSHIALSGDLVNLALPDEFMAARHWLQQLGDPAGVSLCFGNHDAYVTGAYSNACAIFAPWLISDKIAGLAKPANSASSAKSAGSAALPDLAGDNTFPCIKIRGQVAIIDVSSAVAMPPFIAAGYVNAKQCRRLEDLLTFCARKNLFRVINIHHPPIAGAAPMLKRLWGMTALQKSILAYGAELIIHGHTHRATINYLGDIPVVGVGSASEANHTYAQHSNYNSFAITETAANKWKCSLTRHSFIENTDEIESSAAIRLL